MARAGVWSCALPAQALERGRVSTWKQKPRSCFVSVIPASSIIIRGCVQAHPQALQLAPSSLDEFIVLQADAVKHDVVSNVESRIEFYSKLTLRLAGDGHLLEMADLLGTLLDAGIVRHDVISSMQMRDVRFACRSALDAEKLDSFIEFARKLLIAGVPPMKFVGDGTVSILSRRCKEMLSRGEVDKCVDLLTTLAGCGFSVRRLMEIRVMVAACAKHGNVEAALRYARLLPKVNLHYNCIMQQFAVHGTLEAVFAAFTSMTESGIKPDMYSYRSLLDACAHHKDIGKATSVFKEVVSSGSIPNVFVYNSFMNVCAEYTDTVWEIYDDMLLLGVEPDLVTYNIMLKSCSLSKSFDKAISLYMRMEKKAASGSLILDVFTYTTTIHILGDAKQLDLALKVKDDMLLSGVTPNTMTWTALVGASGNAGMADQAFALFNEMLLAGCAPNEQTYNLLINACRKARQHERAIKLFKEWRVQGQIFSHREREQRESDAESVQFDLETRQTVPDKKTPVSKIFPGKSSRSMPDLVTYNILMKSCGDEPDRVKEIMEDIFAAGLKPNLTSFSTYIDAHGNTGDLLEAIKFFKLMKEDGITPDVVVYTSLIKACVKAGDADKAFKFFIEMKDAGVQPNKVTYYTLLKAQRTCRKLSDAQRALALYEEMREAGFAPNDRILRVLLEQWAEGAIEDGSKAENPAQNSLEFEKEGKSAFSEYSKLLLQNVAVDTQDFDAEPHLTIDLRGLSRGEARVAVLSLLRVIKERHSRGYRVKDDLVVVTGVGRQKEVPGSAIVRQAVLHVLEKELKLPVLCCPTEVHVARKVPPRIFSDNHDLTSDSNNQHQMEAITIGSVSTESTGSSSTCTDTKQSISQSVDALLVRKPTNFGRLIVEKEVLDEWLMKRSSLPGKVQEKPGG